MKILVADDDQGTRLLLSGLLRSLGHHVVTATNGRQAWEEFEQGQFSVLITDWLMPERDGLELCRMVRRAHRAAYTYVIVLTALGGKQHNLMALEAGADDFLTKPPDPEELTARLRVAERVVGLQRDVRQLAGLLEVCMYCKRIHEAGRWVALEQYVATRTEAAFSPGACPECADIQAKSATEAVNPPRGTPGAS